MNRSKCNRQAPERFIMWVVAPPLGVITSLAWARDIRSKYGVVRCNYGVVLRTQDVNAFLDGEYIGVWIGWSYGS